MYDYQALTGKPQQPEIVSKCISSYH